MIEVIRETHFHIYLEPGDEMPPISHSPLCHPPKNATIHIHIPAKSLPGKDGSIQAAELNGRFLGDLESAGSGRGYLFRDLIPQASAPEKQAE